MVKISPKPVIKCTNFQRKRPANKNITPVSIEKTKPIILQLNIQKGSLAVYIGHPANDEKLTLAWFN